MSNLWNKTTAKYASRCCICNKPYMKGQIIWWHATQNKRQCDPCWQGKDTSERQLTSEQKELVNKVKERLMRLDSLPSPLAPDLRREYNDLLAELNNFSDLKAVRAFIAKLNYAEEINAVGGIPKRVDHTFYGMRNALVKEHAELPELVSTVADAEQLDNLSIITLVPGAARRLLELQDYWSAVGKSRNGDSSWCGQVVDVDLREPVKVVVRLERDSLCAEAGDRVIFLAPDFQKTLREWINKSIEEKRKLPDNYLKIAAGHPMNSQTLTNLSSHLEGAELRTSQREAIKLLQKPLGIVWGPPGTGKTFTLGVLASLVNSERKLIVLAPTNVAADQAALSIDDAFARKGMNLKDGELIRPGNPCLAKLEERTHLMSWSIKQKESRSQIEKLMRSKRKLEAKRGQCSDADRDNCAKEISQVKIELDRLKRERSKELWFIAHQAKIVVTTLHSFLFNKELVDLDGEQPVTLFLDEASMVPRCFFTRLLELDIDQLLLFGDFKQLSPVRLNDESLDENSRFWVADSAFATCGLRNHDDALRLEKNGELVMLTEQNRMNRELCQIVSQQFYNGRLTTVSGHEPPMLSEFQGKSMLLVDKLDPKLSKLSHGLSVAEQPNTCLRSLNVSINLARFVLDKKPDASILLLTPFRSQAYNLRKLAETFLPADSNWNAGTVHVGQGQEADVVIFNPVDPLHNWFTGAFGWDDLEEMLCVAYSRARSHQITVGSPTEIRSSSILGRLCKNSTLWSL